MVNFILCIFYHKKKWENLKSSQRNIQRDKVKDGSRLLAKNNAIKKTATPQNVERNLYSTEKIFQKWKWKTTSFFQDIKGEIIHLKGITLKESTSVEGKW